MLRKQGGTDTVIESGDTLTVESGGSLIVESGATVRFEDSAVLKFGTGDDVTLTWDGTHFLVTGLPTSDTSTDNAVWANSNVLTLGADT